MFDCLEQTTIADRRALAAPNYFEDSEMKRKSLFVSVVLLCLASLVPVPGAYAAVSETSNRGTCPRYPAGSSLVEPKDLFRSHGILQVSFTYETRVDEYGNVLYCFHERGRKPVTYSARSPG